MTSPSTLLWFRQDLRLQDNPALQAAAREGNILPVYILDDSNAGDWAMGAASRWWLHHSLTRLNAQLENRLAVLAGDPLEIIPALMNTHGIEVILSLIHI